MTASTRSQVCEPVSRRNSIHADVSMRINRGPLAVREDRQPSGSTQSAGRLWVEGFACECSQSQIHRVALGPELVAAARIPCWPMIAANEFWAPGTQILWQYKSPNGLPWIDPMTVVQDDSNGLVAWLAAGTETLQAQRPDGSDLRADKSKLFTGDRVGVRRPWRDHDVLRIAPTGKRWSVWLLWDCNSREFRGWYGNLEAP